MLQVALPVHMSQTLSLKGSATNSYSGPSMMLLGQTSGGWALGSLVASSFWAGRSPRCSRQRRRRSVVAWWPALKGWPSISLSIRFRSSITMDSSLSWTPICDYTCQLVVAEERLTIAE